MTEAFVALGANLGDARTTVSKAMEALDALPATRVTARSSLYRSAPVDAPGPDFVNAVVRLDTKLDALSLLRHLQRLEQAAGRDRAGRHAPRTLDLDLLLYGSTALQGESLTLPHPRMGQRAFVLVPLAEVAPARVSAMQLAGVADQRIERCDGP